MNSELKARARQQLGEKLTDRKWIYAAIAMGTLILVEQLLSVLKLGLLSILITGPLNYSIAFMFLKQSRDGELMNLNDLIKGFTDDFLGNFLLGLLQSLFITLFAILLVFPGVMKAYSYAMAFFIKTEHPDFQWRACLNASKEMMYGHRMDLFKIDLVFLLITLGCGLLVALIPVVRILSYVVIAWVSAWCYATHAQFYNELVSNTYTV